MRWRCLWNTPGTLPHHSEQQPPSTATFPPLTPQFKGWVFFRKPICFCCIVSPAVLHYSSMLLHVKSLEEFLSHLIFQARFTKAIPPSTQTTRWTAVTSLHKGWAHTNVIIIWRQAACHELLLESPIWKESTLSSVAGDTILNCQKNRLCRNFCCQLCVLHEVISAKRGAWYGTV